LGYNKPGVMPETGKRVWSLNQGKRLGLFSGSVSSELSLRRADAVKLLFNMLDAPALDISSVTIDSDGYVVAPSYVESDDGALYYFRKIYRKRGVVDATEFTAMYDESTLGEGQISVDGINYIINANADFDRYVGVYCDVYITEETNTSKILSVTPSHKTESFTIGADEFVSYTKSGNTKTISYSPNDKDGKIYKVSLNNAAAVISNGYGLKTYTQDDFKITKGDITLYDNDSDGKYDTVILNSAKTVLVDSINLAKGEIYNKFTFDADVKTITANASDTDTKLTILRGGEEIELENLMSGEILDVYFNKKAEGKKRIVKIFAGGESLRGVIKSVSGDLETIKIGDKSYEVSPWYISAGKATPSDKYAPELKAGMAYVFYIDPAGKIVAAETDKYEGMLCGYLYRTAQEKEAFDVIYRIRVYTENGRWEVYELAEKVRLDDDTKKASVHFAAIDAQKGSLILFKTNTEGKVCEIRCATETFVHGKTSENFNKSELDPSVDSKAKYRNISNYFEGSVSKNLLCYFNAKTKMFGIPTGSNISEDDFGMVSSGALDGDADYIVKAFGLDEFGIADYIVIETDDEMRKEKLKSGTVMLVSEAYDIMNSEGDVVKCIVGPYEFLSKYTVMFSPEAVEYDRRNNELTTQSQINVGDLIRFTQNEAGQINNYSIICGVSDAENSSGYFPSLTEQPRGLHTSMGYMSGKAVACKPEINAFMLDVRESADEPELLKTGVTSSSVKVFVCEGNSRQRTISMGSLRDMVKGDFVFAVANWAQVHTIVIYK